MCIYIELQPVSVTSPHHTDSVTRSSLWPLVLLVENSWSQQKQPAVNESVTVIRGLVNTGVPQTKRGSRLNQRKNEIRKHKKEKLLKPAEKEMFMEKVFHGL